jgi:tetratricopeptide (TPR) repeat protein
MPMLMAYILISAINEKKKSMAVYFAGSILCYLCLIFANAKAGMFSFYVVDAFFWMVLFYKRVFNFKELSKYFLALHIGFAVCTFIYGSPVSRINNFSLSALQNRFVVYAEEKGSKISEETLSRLMGITDSWEIRKLIWRGAVEAWKANPILGSGVKTFEYAYHKYRPAEHNLTSEWDNTYTEPHNEYLDYLASTGIFGLGAYLLFLAGFIFIAGKHLFGRKDIVGQYLQSFGLKSGTSGKTHEAYILFLLNMALFCSFLSILITNFFGFSIVIINLYLFFIPAFFFFLSHKFKNEKKHSVNSINLTQWIMICIVIIISCVFHFRLFRYWYADTVYTKGYNLNRAGDHRQAYRYLNEAVKLEPDEPVYKNELALNIAMIVKDYFLRNESAKGAQLVSEAIDLSSEVIRNHPKILAFWKNRFNIFNLLAESDKKHQNMYYDAALAALINERELAPRSAIVSYNFGLLLEQTGRTEEAEAAFKEAIRLKPDFYEAYDTLAKLYHKLAIGQKIPEASELGEETIVNPMWQQKAIGIYREYLTSPYYKFLLKKQGKEGM